LRMMRASKEDISRRAEAIAAASRSARLAIDMIDGESVIGGGAAPSAVLPTCLLAITCEDMSADEISSHLRASEPPVVARVDEGRVLLDLRTVFPEQDRQVIDALTNLAS